MDQDEPLQHAAERELKEETSLDAKDLLFTQVRALQQHAAAQHARRRSDSRCACQECEFG